MNYFQQKNQNETKRSVLIFFEEASYKIQHKISTVRACNL